ncbi:MAG TPA: hypothetical protein VMH36_17555 [Alphaproteobacteria bacterium]|nr:hypothetical protein [Alphaproteobacteria bacterium]
MPSETELTFSPAPSVQYSAPEDLLRDSAVPRQRKRDWLAQWQRDLKQLQTATEENMPRLDRATPAAHADDGKTAELLQRVSNCLLRLERE